MRIKFIILYFIFFAACWGDELPVIKEIFSQRSTRPIAKLSYKDNAIKARALYRYDERDLLIESIIDDGCSEDPFSLEGVTEQIIIQYIHPSHAIDEDHPEEVIEKFHDLTTGETKVIKHVINTYVNGIQLIKRIVMDGLGNVIETIFDGTGRISSLIEKKANGSTQLTDFTWDDHGNLEQTTQQTDLMPTLGTTEEEQALQASRDSYAQLFSRVTDFFSFFSFSNQQKPAFEKLRHDFESIAEFVLGSYIFQISGYYVYPAAIGTYGQGEISNKVRISAINGLFNIPEDRLAALKLISRVHGGCNIHYVARPYEGWTRDTKQALMSKFGFLSHQSFALASTWKKLILEMGGIHSGGTIIHYAHSLGGSETNNARTLMTPEELKMIKVYTFGSPTMISSGEFQSVVNYWSGDPISLVFDLFSLIKAYFSSNTNIVYLSVYYPQHELASEAYLAMLEKLGAEFVDTYIKVADHVPAFVID